MKTNYLIQYLEFKQSGPFGDRRYYQLPWTMEKMLDRYHYMWSELYNMNAVIMGFTRFNHDYKEGAIASTPTLSSSSSPSQWWTRFFCTPGKRARSPTTPRRTSSRSSEESINYPGRGVIK